MRSPQEEFLAFIQPYKGIITSAIRRGCGATYPYLRADVEQESICHSGSDGKIALALTIPSPIYIKLL